MIRRGSVRANEDARREASRRASAASILPDFLRRESEPELPSFDFVKRLPALPPYAKDEVILKKTTAGGFAARRIVCIATHIFICPEDSDEVLDDILLHEIESVFQVGHLACTEKWDVTK